MNGQEAHHLLGAYLLGGLDLVDAQEFRRHLRDCPQCRAELADLERLPVLLDALPVPDAVALTGGAGGAGAFSAVFAAPAPAPGQLLARLGRRRRKVRRRWAAVAGAAAALFLAVGLATGPALNQPQRPDASYSVQSGGGLEFSVDLARKTWGTELAVNASSLPKDGTLSLWIRDRDGGADRACAWTATPSGKVKVTGATPVQLARIASVELRDGTQQAVAVITVPE